MQHPGNINASHQMSVKNMVSGKNVIESPFTYFVAQTSRSTMSRQLEHEGSINFIKVIVSQLCGFQQGLGVVAVSPRYAERIIRKFSVLWELPPTRVQVRRLPIYYQ